MLDKISLTGAAKTLAHFRLTTGANFRSWIVLAASNQSTDVIHGSLRLHMLFRWERNRKRRHVTCNGWFNRIMQAGTIPRAVESDLPTIHFRSGFL